MTRRRNGLVGVGSTTTASAVIPRAPSAARTPLRDVAASAPCAAMYTATNASDARAGVRLDRRRETHTPIPSASQIHGSTMNSVSAYHQRPFNGISQRMPYVFIQSRNGCVRIPMADNVSNHFTFGGSLDLRRQRCQPSMTNVNTMGRMTSAGTPWVIPRRNPRLWPNGTERTSTSGRLAAIINVADPNAVLRFNPASASAAPTRVWQTLSMRFDDRVPSIAADDQCRAGVAGQVQQRLEQVRDEI